MFRKALVAALSLAVLLITLVGIAMAAHHESKDQTEISKLASQALKIMVLLDPRGKLAPGPLITHRFPLEDINEAFAVAAGREVYGSVKVLVIP